MSDSDTNPQISSFKDSYQMSHKSVFKVLISVALIGLLLFVIIQDNNYKSYLIFALVLVSIFLGYALKSNNEFSDIPEQMESLPPSQPIVQKKETARIPEEFKMAQDAFKNSNQNLEEMKDGTKG